MLAIKTPLAVIVSIIIAVVAYFIADATSGSNISIFLPSIMSLVTLLVLLILSSIINSKGQTDAYQEEEHTSPKPVHASTQTAPKTNDASNSSDITTLYIGNLAYKANEKLVEEHFATVGAVISVRLVKDKKTGRRKGFGFVEISAADESTFIDKLNESEFMERNIIVRPANEKKH